MQQYPKDHRAYRKHQDTHRRAAERASAHCVEERRHVAGRRTLRVSEADALQHDGSCERSQERRDLTLGHEQSV